MRLDLDARLTAALIIGGLVFLGNAVASMFGLPVNDTIVGGSVTLVLATLGIGIFRGSA